jgi:hypothetical protein
LGCTQAAIAARRFVVTFCKCERVLPPCEQRDAVALGSRQNRSGEARQVDISREVVEELLNGHAIAAPKRHLVEVLVLSMIRTSRQSIATIAVSPAISVQFILCIAP